MDINNLAHTKQECKYQIASCLFVFEAGSLSQCGIQDFFTDTQALGSYLKQLIGINKFQGLLQAEDLGRCQFQRIIGS